MVLRNLADGITLVGWAPPFYAFQHHMINGKTPHFAELDEARVLSAMDAAAINH
eukprot:SAG22_NODE_3244_length_1835_cov_1.137673_2_plen_54_part_00